MWVSENFEDLVIAGHVPTGMTIGAFDGVHLGHQALIRWMVAEAHRQDLQAVVLTFDPLPRQILEGLEGGLLSTCEERLALIASLDVDGVIVLHFDQDLARTPAEDFLGRLNRYFSLKGLWVGPGFALGRGRQGNVAFLQDVGITLGFQVHVFPHTVFCQGAAVRSSRVRQTLKQGDVAAAWDCLGRPYQLAGRVCHGDGRGRTLGFPTANVDVPIERLLPAHGVYVCRAHLPQGSFDAVTNVGIRPTFQHSFPQIEAHLLDFSADVYEAPIQLDFLHHLRREMAFSSIDELVVRMHHDVVAARLWLQTSSM
ncbi:MAG: riboflavin biosynthesis protein RibF [Anaerolineae bacterium]|nr:riboflavin biosynthesis protein RibF [Anaerolineae bacterium]